MRSTPPVVRSHPFHLSYPKTQMKKSLLLLLFLTLSIGVAWAQKKQITVKGIVLSVEDKEPIVPASVQSVDYPNIGTLTDPKGRFTLHLPEGARTLRVSSVGYASKVVTITGKELRILLDNDEQSIDKVVIVAYGTQKKQSLVGAQASISGKQLAARPISNASNALAGAAAGVQVTTSSGQPGSEADIRIRGFGSVNASSAPLYVVDGAVYTGRISDIAQQDIADISVLKDAAATALYGSSAGNGVILITTKRNAGQAGQPHFSFSTSQGFSVRGLPEYDKIGTMDHYKVRWQQWYNTLRYNERNKNKTDEELGTIAALQTYQALKYNPYSGIDSYYRKDANGVYHLSKGGPAKGAYPGILLPNGELNPEINGLLYGDDLDWYNAFYRTGHRGEYTLSGGLRTDKLQSYLSLNYLNERGFMIESGYKRYNLRANLSYDIRPWLTLGTNIGLTHTRSEGPRSLGGASANGAHFSQTVAPIYPIHVHDPLTGAYVLDDRGNKIYDHSGTRPYRKNYNTIELAYLDHNESLRDALMGRAHLDIKPIDGLKLSLQVAYDQTNSRSKVRYNNKTGDNPQGVLNVDVGRGTTLTFTQLANYTKKLGKDHEFEGLIAHESYDLESFGMSGSKEFLKFIVIDELSNYTKVRSVNSSTDVYRKESYFGRFNYNYSDRYNLSLAYRRDGSSRFHKNSRWGNFWAVGAGWNINSEKFMKNVSWVNRLKLRGSYGQTGNDGLSGYYPYQTTYGSSNNLDEPGLRVAHVGNTDLTWETQITSDVALEFGLFDRIDGTIEVFNKESKDLLFEYELAASTGVASIDRNIGKVRNYGLELELGAKILRIGDFSWSLRANATWLKNKIVKLPDLNREDGIIVGTKKYLEGRSLYDYYLYEYLGVDPADGKAMYRLDREKYPDEPGLEATGERATYTKNGEKARKHYAGSSIPDVYGGFSTNFRYKDIGLNFVFAYQIGGKSYDGLYQSMMSRDLTTGTAMHPDLYRAWRKPGQVTDVPRLDADPQNFSTMTSDRWLISSTALALKSISMSYDLPKRFAKKLGVDGVGLTFAAENLFILSKRKGLNPFSGYTGVHNSVGYAAARTFTTTLNVTF